MPETISFALPEGMGESSSLLIDQSIFALKSGDEMELAEWGESVRSAFEDESVQRQLADDIEDALGEFRSSISSFPEAERDPNPMRLLLGEFAAFFKRKPATLGDYDSIDHSLDIGEILIDSLKDALERHPFSAGILSVIKELVKMGKAVNKRLKQ